MVILLACFITPVMGSEPSDVRLDSFLVKPTDPSEADFEGRVINKVAIIMGSKFSISNIRDAFIHTFSDYKVEFAQDGTDIEVILATEYLYDRSITHLKLIDHGSPGLLENLDPFDIPDGASLWMAPSAVVEVYACNYGHGIELFRKNLAKRLLEMYGGVLVSYRGWVFPFTVVSPTKDGEEDSLFIEFFGIRLPKLSWPDKGVNHTVIDTVESDEEGVVKRYLFLQ